MQNNQIRMRHCIFKCVLVQSLNYIRIFRRIHVLPVIFFGLGTIPFASHASQAGNDFVVVENASPKEKIASYYTANGIAILKNGNAVIAWHDYSNPNDKKSATVIRAKILDPAGGVIKPDFQISSTTSGDQLLPQIALIKNSKTTKSVFIVVWTDSGQKMIRGRLFTEDGSPIGSDFPINPSGGVHMEYPRVAGLNDGRFVVVWTDFSGKYEQGVDESGSLYAVVAQIYDANGKPENEPFRVNYSHWGTQQMPALRAFEDGRFVVSWAGHNSELNPTWAIKARVFDQQGKAVTSDILVGLSEALEVTVYSPSLVTLAGGGFAVSWTSEANTVGYDPHKSMAKIRFYNGMYSAVSGENSFHSEEVGFGDATALAASGAGNADEVIGLSIGKYLGVTNPSLQVFARRFSNSGEPLGKSFVVNSADVMGTPFGPTVAVGSDGFPFAVWTLGKNVSIVSGVEKGNVDIRACRFNAALATPCTLESSPENSKQQPKVSITKSLSKCEIVPEASGHYCEFTIEILADDDFSSDQLHLVDLTNVKMKSFSSDYPAFNSNECSIFDFLADGNQQKSMLSKMQINPVSGISNCEPQLQWTVGPAKSVKIVSGMLFDPDSALSTPIRNCVAAYWDETKEEEYLHSCIDVPICFNGPWGGRYWGQFDTDLNEADAGPSGLVPSKSYGASLTPTTIPGHAGMVLKLDADGWLEYNSINQSPFGFRRNGVPNAEDSGDFSIEFWIRMQSHSGRVAILDTRRVFSDGNGVLVSSQNGNVHLQIREKNGLIANWVATPKTGTISDGEWHHVAITVDRDNSKGGAIFVDGIPVTIAGGGGLKYFDPTPFNDKALGANNPLTIGRNRQNGENSHAFEIDELEIFHRVLGSGEIAGLQKGQKCK